ncbi:MAG TPA: hypothetical protein VFJ21_06750 [Mycobacteriales bacterium]|nr:hypothetical protein [Mycobacteriales bacterium]
MGRERIVAAVCAGVLVSGVAVAVAGNGDGPTRPTAESRAAADVVTSSPTPSSSRPPAPPRRVEKTDRAPAGPKPAALPYPIPMGPVQPQPCPPPPPKGGPYQPKPLGAPAVPEGALWAPHPVKPRHVDLAAVSGKGMWLTTWADSHVDVARVVAQAKAAGLRSLWVRTGGSYQGYYGNPLLAALLPAAHAAGIRVVAWDFPTLSDPVADARRAGQALAFSVGGQRVDAFAPDVETPAEGVFQTPRRIALYLSLVREYAANRPVVATVPRPTDHNMAAYPYATEAPYVDAFAPMVYWSCNEPGLLARTAVERLSRWRPVNVVGQSYDMGPEGGRPGLPSGAEIWRYLDVTKRYGGIGASLYLYSQTGHAQWAALAAFPWR